MCYDRFMQAELVVVMGGSVGVVAILVRSYLKLRRLEGKLEAEVARNKSMLESLGEGLVVLDKDGRVELLNRTAERLIGWTTEEVKGKSWYEVGVLVDEKGNSVPAEKRMTQVVLKTGQARSTARNYYVRRDKTKFPVSTTAAPIVLNGKTIGVIAVFRDVTHEKEVDRAKSEFVSLASHQLRTPLSAIKWFCEMLLDGDAGPLNLEQLEYIASVDESNERMIELVNSLLDIARIESGRITISPVPTNLGELVKQVLFDLQTRVKEKKHQMVVSVHEELPLVNVDPRMVRQVYMNLLTNAVKYTPEGGEISVFVSRKGKEIISQVTDNGYGIPVGDQALIFEKFHRAENILKRETEGTGLGLYLARAIVESSGGKMWFESREGQGTTFWFSLPLAGTPPKKGEVTLGS